MGEKLRDILNECIDAILQGEEIEQCLARYPDHAEELEPLLRLALATKQASSLEPRPEFKAAARYRFLSALSATREPQKTRFGFFRWQRRWAIVTATTLIIFLFGAGMVHASSDAVPGDILYPVKTTTEQGQLFFTHDEEARGRLYLKFARRRLHEIEVLSQRKRAIPSHVLDNMALYTIRIADRLGYYESEEISDELLQLTSQQQRVLEGMRDIMPVRSRRAFQEAMLSSERGNQLALEAIRKYRLRIMTPGKGKERPNFTPKSLPVTK